MLKENINSTYYPADRLPSERELVADSIDMTRLYDNLVRPRRER